MRSTPSAEVNSVRIRPQPPRLRMKRRKTVSVTPAMGASTVAGAIFTPPRTTDGGTGFSPFLTSGTGFSQYLRTSGYFNAFAQNRRICHNFRYPRHIAHGRIAEQPVVPIRLEKMDRPHCSCPGAGTGDLGIGCVAHHRFAGAFDGACHGK